MADPMTASSDQWQDAMLNACSAGRLDELQRLFAEHDIHQVELYDSAIADALLEPPLDPDMLKLVCSHTPNVSGFEYDNRQTSILSKACEGGPKNVAFIHVLLDHGAVEALDYSYTVRLGGPLTRAVQCGQPIDVIRRMASKTPCLWFPIFSAVSHKRADVLDVLLSARSAQGELRPTELSGARSWLGGEADADMVDVIERHIKSWERQFAISSKRDLQAKKKGVAKQWWPFGGTATEPKGKTPVHSSPTAVESDGPSQSWWPWSRNGNRLESAVARFHDKMKHIDDSSSDEEC